MHFHITPNSQHPLPFSITLHKTHYHRFSFCPDAIPVVTCSDVAENEAKRHDMLIFLHFSPWEEVRSFWEVVRRRKIAQLGEISQRIIRYPVQGIPSTIATVVGSALAMRTCTHLRSTYGNRTRHKMKKAPQLRGFLWEHTGSNRGPSACKADALNQLSYAPICIVPFAFGIAKIHAVFIPPNPFSNIFSPYPLAR